MTDFSAYKAGDIMKLQVTLTIENDSHCSCCSPEYSTKQIINEFKILQVVKRGDDFIFIFERSNVFENHGNLTDDSSSVLINSFILDTGDTNLLYDIFILDKDWENMQKLESIKNLKKIIKNNSKIIEQLSAEYLELDKQLAALINFPESKAYGLILNGITEINLQISKNRESLFKAHAELKILENT